MKTLMYIGLLVCLTSCGRTSLQRTTQTDEPKPTVQKPVPKKPDPVYEMESLVIEKGTYPWQNRRIFLHDLDEAKKGFKKPSWLIQAKDIVGNANNIESAIYEFRLSVLSPKHIKGVPHDDAMYLWASSNSKRRIFVHVEYPIDFSSNDETQHFFECSHKSVDEANLYKLGENSLIRCYLDGSLPRVLVWTPISKQSKAFVKASHDAQIQWGKDMVADRQKVSKECQPIVQKACKRFQNVSFHMLSFDRTTGYKKVIEHQVFNYRTNVFLPRSKKYEENKTKAVPYDYPGQLQLLYWRDGLDKRQSN